MLTLNQTVALQNNVKYWYLAPFHTTFKLKYHLTSSNFRGVCLLACFSLKTANMYLKIQIYRFLQEALLHSCLLQVKSLVKCGLLTKAIQCLVLNTLSIKEGLDPPEMVDALGIPTTLMSGILLTQWYSQHSRVLRAFNFALGTYVLSGWGMAKAPPGTGMQVNEDHRLAPWFLTPAFGRMNGKYLWKSAWTEVSEQSLAFYVMLFDD